MLRLARSHQRGVSLIEALIAFAVMAFGMLAVVGMQATLRSNADLARQRAEAVRMGQDAIEEWRGFTVQGLTTDKRAYDEIVAGSTSETFSALSVPGATEPTPLNTTYTVTRNVITEATANPLLPMPAARKTLLVEVTWTDRRNEAQSVRLSTTIAWVDPATEASLLLAMNRSTMLLPGSQARGIPPGAVKLPGGSMGWIPPNQPTPTDGNRYTLWTFNTLTGVITICKTDAANMAAFDPLTFDRSLNECSQVALLVTGYLRFDASSPPPTTTSVANPIGVVPGNMGLSIIPEVNSSPISQCFFDATGVPGGTAYYCAVSAHEEEFPEDGPLAYLNRTPLWNGLFTFSSPQVATAATPFNQLESLVRICRYPDVKLSYQHVSKPLLNQNFVMFTAGESTGYFDCPSLLAAGVDPEHPPVSAADLERMRQSVFNFAPLTTPTTSP